jgi:hypothetical protein
LTAADTVATGNLTVTTAQTTGPLFFTSTASTAGNTVNVTGGGGDDSITGGGLADTLSGGSGSDTIVGGAGNDTINSGSGNNNVAGGAGSDSIDLTGGGSDLVKFDTVRSGTTVWSDTITGFAQANDMLSFSIGAMDAGGAAFLTLSNSKGTDISAAGNMGTVLSVVTNTNVTASTAQMLKFSSTTATSFASAIGTATVTLDVGTTGDFAVGAPGTGTTEGILAVYYNATNSQMVIGVISNLVGQTGGALDVITTDDTFTQVAVVGMTSADFTAMVAGNFSFF